MKQSDRKLMRQRRNRRVLHRLLKDMHAISKKYNAGTAYGVRVTRRLLSV